MSNIKLCLLCGNTFMARDVRKDELCPDHIHHKRMVQRYRGSGGSGSIGQGEKQRILGDLTTHWGTGHRFDYFDKLKNENNPATEGMK